MCHSTDLASHTSHDAFRGRTKVPKTVQGPAISGPKCQLRLVSYFLSFSPLHSNRLSAPHRWQAPFSYRLFVQAVPSSQNILLHPPSGPSLPTCWLSSACPLALPGFHGNVHPLEHSSQLHAFLCYCLFQKCAFAHLSARFTR